MPRSQQSKEAAIIAFFRTAPMEVASVVLGLCREALKERTTRSVEARERALAAQKKAVAAPQVVDKRTKPKAKAKAKAKPRTRRQPVEPPYTEDDLNGTVDEG